MTFDVEIVLRERNYAVTEQIEHGVEPRSWRESDVELVLKQILLALDRVKNHGGRSPLVRLPGFSSLVALGGFSWIVEHVDGHVVTAIEIPIVVAVAAPFAIEQGRIDGMIRRVI